MRWEWQKTEPKPREEVNWEGDREPLLMAVKAISLAKKSILRLRDAFGGNSISKSSF